MNTIAITGTNTDIGKTYVACGLASELRARGISVGVFKPFCSGSREDAEKLIAAAGVDDSLNDVNPCYFEQPLAPYHAAKLSEEKIDLKKCFDTFDILRQKYEILIVEGAGGILVPILETETGVYSFLDLFKDTASDIIIVASRKLGTINHSWLTANVCKEAGLNVLGFVFNDVEETAEREPAISNPEIIARCSGAPVLGVVRYNDSAPQWKSIADKILNERKL